MSEYIRTTRECSVTDLHPEIFQAIGMYFQEHKIGHLQAETIACCETISEKKKKESWLSGKQDRIIYTGMVLTSEWLIWVHYGDRSGIRLNAANLKEIGAGYHTSLLTKDAGLEIAGYIGDTKARVRGYVAMGADPAAEKFCEEVKQAILKINPPEPSKPFKWLSGG
jgi:hypothetical protein